MLLPLLNSRECGHIRVNINSLYIGKSASHTDGTAQSSANNSRSSSNSSSTLKSSVLFGKQIEVNGISVEMCRVSDNTITGSSTSTSERNTFMQQLSSRPTQQLLLNPLQVVASVLIKRDHSLEDGPESTSTAHNSSASYLRHSGHYASADDREHHPKSGFRLDIHAQLSNLEVTPNISQLSLAREIVEHASSENIRRRYLAIRPVVSPTEDPRLWWQFVIKAVLHLVKGRHYVMSSESVKINNTGHDDCILDSRGGGALSDKGTNRAALGKRYLLLYRKYFETKLYCIRHADELKAKLALREKQSGPSEGDFLYPYTLSNEDLRSLDDIQQFLDVNKLLSYRKIVYEALRKGGVSLQDIRKAYSFNAAVLYEVVGGVSAIPSTAMLNQSRLFDKETIGTDTYSNRTRARTASVVLEDIDEENAGGYLSALWNSFTGRSAENPKCEPAPTTNGMYCTMCYLVLSIELT